MDRDSSRAVLGLFQMYNMYWQLVKVKKSSKSKYLSAFVFFVLFLQLESAKSRASRDPPKHLLRTMILEQMTEAGSLQAHLPLIMNTVAKLGIIPLDSMKSALCSRLTLKMPRYKDLVVAEGSYSLPVT